MCCVALAVLFHLFTVPTKEVGDQRTLDGDLGDSIGDFVTGFGIGFSWEVDGVVTLALPAGSLPGYIS